jgi:hypothetical protein
MRLFYLDTIKPAQLNIGITHSKNCISSAVLVEDGCLDFDKLNFKSCHRAGAK